MKDFANLFVRLKGKNDLFKETLKVIRSLCDDYDKGKEAEKVMKAVQAEIYRLEVLEVIYEEKGFN